MPDHKPPHLDGDDRQTVLALWQYQRESFVRKLVGVDEADARRPLVASGTTLLWLAEHMARAETLWVVERFAGEPAGVVGEDHADDTLAAAIERYCANWTRIDEIVRRAELDDVCRNVGDGSSVNLRWVLMHLLEETARHAGHADILRELIDGATGR